MSWKSQVLVFYIRIKHCRTHHPLVAAADIISAVTFDHTGQHLATGDRGGRVVLFERVPTQQVHSRGQMSSSTAVMLH